MKAYRPLICILLFSTVVSSWADSYDPAPAVSGRTGRDIEPRDVFSRVIWLEKEIRALESFKKIDESELEIAYIVDRASPREVYFAAISLLKKTQRLCFEITGKLGGSWNKDFRNKPVDVFRVLNQVMISIHTIKSYQYTTLSTSEKPTLYAGPTDVYNQILKVSRLVSVLHEEPVTPADVLNVVNKSLGVAQKLHTLIHNRAYTPVTTKTLTQKQPRDVFHNIHQLLSTTTQFSRSYYNIGMLNIYPLSINRDIAPSDVIDIAYLLNAELEYILQSQFIGKKASPPATVKGKITPSVVFTHVNKIRHIMDALMAKKTP